MKVWIMMKGELGEGGRILGVYADKNLAFSDFAKETKELEDTWDGFDKMRPEADGAICISAGCDWLNLVPHDVKATAELSVH